MFTVYGLNGRIFSGPLEGLRALGPVQAVARVRAAERVAIQGEPSPGVLRAGPAPDGLLPGLAEAEPRQREALAAYAQAQAGAAPRSAGQPLGLVGQLMSRRLVTVPLAATLAQGQVLLERAGVGQAPVVNAQGRLVGLLLRADLLPRPEQLESAAAWRAWLERPVAELMWTPVPSAHADTPIRAVAELLLELRLPGLPVLDDGGAPQGFLSCSDILRALTREPPLDLWG